MDGSSDIVSALKKRYANLPPLLLSRSIERAKNEVELFDILETVPVGLPLLWCNTRRRWVLCKLIPHPTKEM